MPSATKTLFEKRVLDSQKLFIDRFLMPTTPLLRGGPSPSSRWRRRGVLKLEMPLRSKINCLLQAKMVE